MGCHFLLQGIFPIQESNPRLLHWQVDFLLLSHEGSPFYCYSMIEICSSWLLIVRLIPLSPYCIPIHPTHYVKGITCFQVKIKWLVWQTRCQMCKLYGASSTESLKIHLWHHKFNTSLLPEQSCLCSRPSDVCPCARVKMEVGHLKKHEAWGNHSKIFLMCWLNLAVFYRNPSLFRH